LGRGETVLAGEVSTVNDDEKDNRFHEAFARFSTIEEDVPPLRLGDARLAVPLGVVDARRSSAALSAELEGRT